MEMLLLEKLLRIEKQRNNTQIGLTIIKLCFLLTNLIKFVDQ